MSKKIDSRFPYSRSVSFRVIPTVPLPITATTNKSFISEIYYNPKLEDKIASIEPKSHVDLSCWNLIDHDISMITREIIKNKQCTDLWLCANKITSQGVALLALKLVNNSILQSLDLSYNHITDAGIYAICQVLVPNRHSSLQKLFLNKNGISNDGIQYLIEMLKTNQTLTEIWLSNNEIGNEGVKQLTNVLINHNRTLKVLVLSFNVFITDSSVDYLLQLFEHDQTLTKLSITNCNLSEIGKTKLRKKAERKKKFEIEV